MGRSYCGQIDFQFDIERWSHPSISDLFTSSQLKDYNLQENECEVHIIPLYVAGWISFTEGVTSRLPEDCYPDESDSEIECITDDNGDNWLDKISKSELDDIWKKIEDLSNRLELNDSRDYCDYEDYSDRHNNYYHPLDDW